MKGLLCLTFISVFVIFGGVCGETTKLPETPPTTMKATEATEAHTTPRAALHADPKTKDPLTTTPGPKTTDPPTTTPDPKTTTVPTTTPDPKTTTVPPTTKDPPTTMDPNITTASNTTAAPPTTTAPKTTIAPSPSAGLDTYTVNGTVNGTAVTCLVMQATIKFTIPYEGNSKNLTYDGVIGQNPVFQGTCEATTDTLTITSGHVTLDFTFKTHDKQYALTELKVTAKTKYFKDGKDMTIVANYSNGNAFQLKLGDYYFCKSQTILKLSSNVEVDITDLQMEGFRTTNTTQVDGKMVLCAGDQKTNSIVPIAVGAALAGLVVVVLIAYLIGRKRSRRGYESV